MRSEILTLIVALSHPDCRATVFFDSRRHRVYISCGEGVVEVVQESAGSYRTLARIKTSSGARTSLFVPELDRLFVAERAGLLGSDATILVLRPVP